MATPCDAPVVVVSVRGSTGVAFLLACQNRFQTHTLPVQTSQIGGPPEKTSFAADYLHPTLPELLEVNVINALAPFILNARHKTLMQRPPERDKHIVIVAAA